MTRYSLSRLADATLVGDTRTLLAHGCSNTALVLAHLAEIDARKLYLPAAYPSMYQYCLGELHLSEDSAAKRIQAARAARRFPAIFEAVAEGRLHLSAVVLLAPHLTEATTDELVAAATHQSKAEVAFLLAERFPRPDVAPQVTAIPPAPDGCEHAPGHTETGSGTLFPDSQHAPGHVAPHAARPRVAPLSAQRVELHFTVSTQAHGLLREAMDLLSHAGHAADLEDAFERGMELLVEQLKKRRCRQTSRPGRRRSSGEGRSVPAEVVREVWERDASQCTFVSESGKRCPARDHLELDHIQPVARGGRSTVENLRLRCHAHNQYEAERTFGAGFMAAKREGSDARSVKPGSRKARPTPSSATVPAPDQDVIPWLRALGFRADEARHAAARCAVIPKASLEDRVRFALSCLAPNRARRLAHNSTSPA